MDARTPRAIIIFLCFPARHRAGFFFFVMTAETLLREKQVLSLYAPVHRVTWWRWVKAGIAPPPIKLGRNVTAWRLSDLELWQQGKWEKESPPNPA